MIQVQIRRKYKNGKITTKTTKYTKEAWSWKLIHKLMEPNVTTAVAYQVLVQKIDEGYKPITLFDYTEKWSTL